MEDDDVWSGEEDDGDDVGGCKIEDHVEYKASRNRIDE